MHSRSPSPIFEQPIYPLNGDIDQIGIADETGGLADEQEEIPELGSNMQQTPISLEDTPASRWARKEVDEGNIVEGRQSQRLAPRYNDFLPTSHEEILQQFIPPTTAGELACVTPPPKPELPAICVRDPIVTDPNKFGLYRVFKTIPSLDPDLKLSLHNVADSKSFTSESVKPSHNPVCGLGVDTHNPSHGPFTNFSAMKIMHWEHGSKSLLEAHINSLVHDIIRDPHFEPDELASFDARRENKCLDAYTQGSIAAAASSKDGSTGFKNREKDASEFEVKDIWHWNIVDIIDAEVASKLYYNHNLQPYKLMFDPGNGDPVERVYGEAYTYCALRQEEEIFQSLPQASPDGLEVVSLSMMLWSNSTHLAQHSTAHLWPIYLFFGNISQNIRSSPNSFSAHHLAYIPELPEEAVCELLLNDDVQTAYNEGRVSECVDGALRRSVLRWHIWAKDYPESDKVSEMGTPQDMACRKTNQRIDSVSLQNRVKKAQKMKYDKGKSITSKAVKDLLDSISLTATENAFSKAFFKYGFQCFLLEATDLLHEFELGEWCRIFIHLLCILEAYWKSSAKDDLNQRYCSLPTFVSGTIRRFSKSVSSLKKMTGHNFEDLLQGGMPCFEGFLPQEHDETVQDLLWDLMMFHGFGKFDMHLDSTIAITWALTHSIGETLRKFADVTCAAFATKELPSEKAVRVRRAQSDLSSGKAINAKILTSNDSLNWRYKLDTPKLHALGYVPDDIVEVGATSSHLTFIGEKEHMQVKEYYQHTTKTNFEVGDEVLPATDPRVQYDVGISEWDYLDLDNFLVENRNDLAYKNFVKNLKDHILSRIFASSSSDFTNDDRNYLSIEKDRIYLHQTVRFNYTKYNVCRGRDTVNPRMHPHIMTLSGDSNHPYSYARLIHIFHIKVRHHGPDSSNTAVQSFNVLFVRWLDFDNEWAWGFKAKHLPRVYFPKASSPEAFGFLDPACVLRASYLMPNFNLGITDDLLAEDSATRQLEFGCNGEIEGSDWVSYYVGIAVDRDMLAHYIGGGVGHKGTRKYLRNLAKDARAICDPADWEGENTELAQSFQAEMEDLDDTDKDE
ncbi:hypothetical protein BT96DRAFT_999289 [Gymnopus androsaceus JB14]|uniref:Uncharacterized protein n=1 Tax=Gymnopus androsaceus JB14 TaxID=1447944 RepID=A0A6A4H784_9AGAR|nr:hypothetical protein BT96DRAFT_999289 [Gymnopus androsaceus JB14]